MESREKSYPPFSWSWTRWYAVTRLDQKNEALILFTWLTVCFTCDWLQENTTFIIYETMLRPNRGQHVVNHAVNTMKCMHIIFYPAYIKDLITLPKTVFSLRETDILSLCRPASASYGLPSLSHPSHRTEYNAYCLGTFISSSTRFVDLSITRSHALTLWNMMKVAN